MELPILFHSYFTLLGIGARLIRYLLRYIELPSPYLIIGMSGIKCSGSTIPCIHYVQGICNKCSVHIYPTSNRTHWHCGQYSFQNQQA